MRHRISWIVVLAVLIGAGVAFFRTVSTAREAAQQSACHGQMYYIYHALLNYHSANGHFPPAYVEGPDGTPWHSWRVLLLPYLEEKSAYDKYNFDEPWNGPNNSKLADKVHVQLFQCPSGPDRDNNLRTNYCVVVGENTAFPGADTVALPNPLKTTSKSIMLVEIARSDIHWMEPRDLVLDQLVSTMGPSFGGPHPKGIGVLRADGTYESLDRNVDMQILAEELRLSEN